ncbi:sorting nexin-29 [Colletes gigas]|uniref:sorting nexin-29 n=1 Tax=Colletes gigas TaxID=935657 RepID=UPI001C9B2C34|nr:sorting nexin-29 [Colletes gigas]
MALRMMSAIVPGTHNVIDGNQTYDHAAERSKLLEDLLAAAKKCHVRFGGRTELATESDLSVTHLCHVFELIFTHGLRTNCIERINSALRHVSDIVSGSSTKSCTSDMAFWPCIKEQLTWHEQERFSILKRVHTDYGRGRAWLRAVLNERSLERHLHSIIDSTILSPFYEDWAFLLDQERSAILPNVAAGLGSILFAIRVDNEELDNNLKGKEIEKQKVSLSEPIISSTIPGPTLKQQKQRKKVPTYIISFDDENDEQEITEATVSVSAPPTCLNSPIVTSTKNSTMLCLSVSQSQTESNDVNVTTNKESSECEKCESFEEEKVLTPITDSGNMGGLVPVSPLDQTLDDMLLALPNYLDDSSEVAEAAVEATEPLADLDTHADTESLDIDALRMKLVATTEILEQAKEDALTSRSQLARLQRQHQNYLERHELQLQTLNRENELLRQQLRKYVTAVQMLRRGSDSTTVSEEDPSLDYHNEAQQYEEKLIQVADMHAELMEFNARLTLQLTNRDRLVKLLQAELECLRGPLNEDDLPSEPPCLIHIWIPSAFLTGQPSDIHHVYQIYVRIRDTEWNIYRRYAQFHALYRELKKHDTIVTTFEFPPKKTIGNKDAKFVEERRQKLQYWLRRIVGRLAQCSPAFVSRPSRQTLISLMPFFGDNPNTEDSRKNNSTRNTFSSSPQYMGL